ncbi:MAG: WG repeat-containing protein, partial [Bacteroidaceae bacterium]|nr:WG repeat-containing protein [Bacteroidaceae bacterium]
RWFSEGLALVEQNGKWSIINKEGKVIVAECGWTTHWLKVGME